jgi:GT2 family glycosyltransferase
MSLTSEAVSTPRVTWLLPVRNGMPFLTDTLSSIEKQTYPNWEVLAWDNGSTDGTVDELRRWIPSRLAGRVVVDQPLALGAARARLVEAAATEYCAWIDADDISAPHRLARQVDFLDTHPHVAAVGSHIAVIAADGSSQGDMVRFPLSDDGIVIDMLKGPGLAQPAVLFRRSAVLAAGNYRDVGPVNVEDYDMWLRLAVTGRLANIDDVLLKYRVHEASTTVESEKAGVLRAATAERFREHAPRLFGCSAPEASMLVSGRHPYALVVFLRIAMQLKKRSGTGIWQTLRAPGFRRAASEYIRPGDYLSRAFFAVVEAAGRLPQQRRVRAVFKAVVRPSSHHVPEH